MSDISPPVPHVSTILSKELMFKDLGLAQEASKDSQTKTPMGDLARKLYEEMIEKGFEDLDFSSIQKLYL